jgi:phenylpropionate dioxygenase-like ring-hydroxylating dioxygenase large terminal subunit
LARETAAILDALAANAAEGFEQALSLPPAIYHDPAILELEVEQLFRREWLCAGRAAEIAEPGDYIARDLAGAPVVAIRQRDGRVRAFANVCLHRAAQLLEGDGHAARISCPYHSWTYDLDGQLVGAPFMQQTPGFDVRHHRLTELRCETWQGFVYVNADAGATPLSTRLAGLATLIEDYRMADYVPVYSTEETWPTNWKCLVENYMDAYHIHRVHRASFAKYGSSEALTTLLDGEDGWSCHYVQEEAGRKAVAPHPDNDWLRRENHHRTWLINVFPAHTMQLQPDMLWYLSLIPQGIEAVRVRWAVSIPREILEGSSDRQAVIDEVMSLVHQVNSEDKPVVENVFRTTASPHATRGRLSYLERNVWQFGRYLARRLCPVSD